MKRRNWVVATLITAALGALALGLHPAPAAGEGLFLAVELREGGSMVARPMLVGETNKPVRVVLRPDAARPPKLTMSLLPRRDVGGYRVTVEVDLPGRLSGATGELALAHGEEGGLGWHGASGTVELKLLLMRVDSPEFDAYMAIARKAAADERMSLIRL